MAEKRCFVIAPIGESGSLIRKRSDKILKHIIRPAVAECGYSAVRADEIGHPGLISRQVIRQIMNDQLVIADLTGHNPNVFYELALRHSLRKPLVQLIEQGESIPFDVADMRTIQINHRNSSGIKKAKEAIVKQIRDLEKGKAEFETPISVATGRRRRSSLEYPDKKQLPSDQNGGGRIKGKRLFQYRGYYPIDIAPKTNIPSLNQKIFVKAISHFLKKENYDKLAAMDLVYLREDNVNDEEDILPDGALSRYDCLIEKYDLLEFIQNFQEENERIFRNFIRIVNDVGDTLKGVYFEILLHNVRNPIRSIIAARNSGGVSGRHLYGPSTRFVVQYVKNQGRRLIRAMEGGSKVCYLKQFNRAKQVKATTTPLYHDRYGLIGILCMNIDIDSVKALDKKGQRNFLERYIKNSGYTPRFEKEDWR